MISLRAIAGFGPATALLLSSLSLNAQTATPASIEQKLESEYTLTKTTADRTDIVTSGSVLVLKKDGILMTAVSSSSPAQNTYKDGKISQGIWKVAKVGGFGNIMARPGQQMQTRTFVAGEKFWVTKITVHEDGVVLDLFSDPFSDVRYYGTLKFPFNKGSYPAPDQEATAVAQVVSIQPDDAAGSGNAGGKPQPASNAAPAAPAPPAAPLAPIAPPPPPPDAAAAAPKTITLKQTKDEVVANFGQPTKVVKVGTKEIDYYPDMKVTFVNNRVTDIQ